MLISSLIPIFVVLVLLCIGLQYLTLKTKSHLSSGNNPIFHQFQRTYFTSYFLALLADWLQGPYLYKLYSYYGFEEVQIAVLYVCGFATSVVFGITAGTLADKFGRKKLCLCFTVLYSFSCLTKLSQSYSILILGRILGGISTSLLFSAFEAWYMYEHIEKHDFPTEWLSVTFSKATFWNGVLAICAGILANTFAESIGYGPVAPFLLAIPFLITSGVLVATQWEENYGNQSVRFFKSYIDSFKTIVSNQKILLIGGIQSLFESVMYMFIFLWTPILDNLRQHLGITFSCFMVCIMIGSSIYQLFISRNILVQHLLAASVVIGILAIFLCIIATKPDNMKTDLAFFAFLLLELAVGIYFPTMGFIRSRILPETQRAAIMNWFRVPLNLIACLGLMWLHGYAYRSNQGNRVIFVICFVLLNIAAILTKLFITSVKNDNDFRQNPITIANGHITPL